MFLAILRMGRSLMDMAIGKGREGIEWSKALRRGSLGMNVVRGARGNGIIGKNFLKLELLLGGIIHYSLIIH